MEQVPKEIATAIAIVMRAIGKIAKDAKNAHGGYKYSSVDAFLEATNPACSEAGLIVKPVQTYCESEAVEIWDKDGKSRHKRMMKFKFKFRLIHESGAMWTDPDDERTVYLDFTGPQTFQAAESFAEKAYMRTLFQIPTGDPDADAQEQHNAEIIRATARAAKEKRETGQEHIAIDFGAGLETIPAVDVPTRIMEHLKKFEVHSEAADWWQSQKFGREQFYDKHPRLAFKLKKDVEAFFAPPQSEVAA